METDPTRRNPDGELVLPEIVIVWIMCILIAFAVLATFAILG